MNLAFVNDQLETLVGEGFGDKLGLEGSSFIEKCLGGENMYLIFGLKNKKDHSERRCLESATVICPIRGKGLTSSVLPRLTNFPVVSPRKNSPRDWYLSLRPTLAC